MTAWICKKCCTVATANSRTCCGEIEKFEPVAHGHLLIAGANGWQKIYAEWQSKWKDHPLIASVSEELNEDGCNSLPIHIIRAMDALIEFCDAHGGRQET